jgi:hypothetical protein
MSNISTQRELSSIKTNACCMKVSHSSNQLIVRDFPAVMWLFGFFFVFLGGLLVADTEGITLVGREMVEGTDCYRIAGNHPSGFGKYELWVAASDSLIRKIKTDRDEEIHRNIAVNADIPADIFIRIK